MLSGGYGVHPYTDGRNRAFPDGHQLSELGPVAIELVVSRHGEASYRADASSGLRGIGWSAMVLSRYLVRPLWIMPVFRERVVLAVQDTTSLNHTTHHATEGLGPISVKQSKAVGPEVYDTMAFTEKGTPLGLLDVQCRARDQQDKGRKERRKQSAIEDKERR